MLNLGNTVIHSNRSAPWSKPWVLCPQTPVKGIVPLASRNSFLKKVNGMGLGRDGSLPRGVWGKAPRFSQKAGGLNGYHP